MTAGSLGFGDLLMNIVPHPLGGITPSEVQAKAKKTIEQVIDGATRVPMATQGEASTKHIYPPEIIRVKASINDACQTFYKKGWTDGLPVIPPIRTAVDEMLACTSHAPDEVVGELPPKGGIATIEKIAINAVMAGCRPEYFPVVLAAVEAISDPENSMAGWASTTGANSPLLIINGSIRDELDINSTNNALGTGKQANATIGRSINLIVRNIGGAKPGTTDMTTYGAAWEFTACIGENEEALPNPWLPLNVERGFAPGANTVSVKSINSQIDIFTHWASEFKQILDTTASSIAGVSNLGVLKGMQVLVAFNPEAARLAEKDGWSKNDIRQYLFEKARLPLKVWKRLGDNIIASELLTEAKTESDDYMMRTIPQPNDILIFILGGEGKHSVWWPGGQGRAVTKSIDKWR